MFAQPGMASDITGFSADFALDQAAAFSVGRGHACLSRAYFRRPAGSDTAERNYGSLDQCVRQLQRIVLSYLISLLVTVAGSAPQFSRITSVWSEKNVRRPVFPNTSGTAVI